MRVTLILIFSLKLKGEQSKHLQYQYPLLIFHAQQENLGSTLSINEYTVL